MAFAAASSQFVEAVGKCSLIAVDTVENAHLCKPLNIIIKKKRFLTRFLRGPKYKVTNYTLRDILKEPEQGGKRVSG